MSGEKNQGFETIQRVKQRPTCAPGLPALAGHPGFYVRPDQTTQGARSFGHILL